MKIGELKELIKDLDDNIEIITTSDNYELGNSWVKARGIRVVKVKQVLKSCRDDFDGTHYTTPIYVTDEKGTETLLIGD